jgi:hypothetical protein
VTLVSFADLALARKEPAKAGMANGDIGAKVAGILADRAFDVFGSSQRDQIARRRLFRAVVRDRQVLHDVANGFHFEILFPDAQ